MKDIVIMYDLTWKVEETEEEEIYLHLTDKENNMHYLRKTIYFARKPNQYLYSVKEEDLDGIKEFIEELKEDED